MRVHFFIVLLLVLSARQFPTAHAQVLVNPTADQLIQIVRSQPAVNISAPVSATASFDPPLVQPGEKAVYRGTFNATAISVSWPEKLPLPAPLKCHLSASGQAMQSVAGSYQMCATFDYEVRAAEAGQFTVPAFPVEVYGQPVVVPAAQLEVKTDLPEPHTKARQLLIESSATNVFVGEVFNASVRLLSSPGGAVEGLSEVQLNGDSFVVDKNSVRQSIQMIGGNGRNGAAFIYDTSVTPIASGPLKLSAQGFTSGNQFGGQIVISGQVTIPGGPPSMLLLDSEPVTINVRPLPTESILPGFTGVVGRYRSDPASLATNVLKVGEPVLLTVVIRGEKNLGRINPPPPPRVPGWQVFPAVRGAIVPGLGTTNPGASFQFNLIPLTTDPRATPAIPFSCFDPALGKYVDLSIAPMPISVLAGDVLTNADLALMLSENTAEPEAKISLSKLAPTPGWTAGSLVPLQMRGWFPLVQLLPALGFCGLWWWDRRRRFLEQHPEIIRRRLARRALRREMRSLELAAQNGNAAGFVGCGISALQIATAPHYPATPRALVCGDVLQILTTTECAGRDGETVRRFFAVADAAAFATAAGTQTSLLAEKSALKEILLKLEARL